MGETTSHTATKDATTLCILTLSGNKALSDTVLNALLHPFVYGTIAMSINQSHFANAGFT